ncbi:anti-sigma regulatory factor [Streptomyces sp.]|uniref:anti-sigma regulatory factor n=1 Tax=Streptomyces sp. TaxID=1931 RepID=UPI00281226D2|nr:anti-sigma regulatory factor [Streptomyces sp.]
MTVSRHAAPATLPIGSDADLAWVRQQVRQAAAELGFGLVQQTKLVTAASELARNTLVHGGGGHMELTPLHTGQARGLRLAFVDSGPGIRDLEQAMTDGYTSGGGLGLGLSGSKRLVQEFEVDSTPGAGTTVTVTAWATVVAPTRPGP